MPLFRHLLPRHKDDEGNLIPKSPKSPRSPKSPSFSKTERNQDYLNQCDGCSNIEILIRRNVEHQKNGLAKVPSGILHNNFNELDQCAHKCEICRIFRQALFLQEVTFDGVKEIQDSQGEVVVRWEETVTTGDKPRIHLNVEIKDQPGRVGIVNCNSQNNVGHLALQTSAFDPVVIEQAKEWLSNCRKTHIGQCDNLRWSSENPRLLVEIISPTSVRLCENQDGEYVALSYCWGNMQSLSKAQQDEVDRGKTLLANLDRRRRPFLLSELPTTVRDALLIIYSMGIRYAWVDTLCIVQDKPEGVATMHKVYSNALFTLCSCATTQATAKLLDQRQAWTQRTEPCRLGGQWLTTPDMSLNELRLRSPLAERAWTLQEERLSPRMLYISSNRMYWSCAQGHEMEMKPTYSERNGSVQKPIYAALDRDAEMPLTQKFLLACYSGTTDLHAYWADIVKSYTMRNMTNLSDRLTALSGLAAKYLSASKHDEYLAGLWGNNLVEGLAWRVNRAIEMDDSRMVQNSVSPMWPSWSWAVLPVQTAIDMDVKSAGSSFFHRVLGGSTTTQGRHENTDDIIERGEKITEIHVAGRLRPLWKNHSRWSNWDAVSRTVDGQEKFTFGASPEQDIHAFHAVTGRILIYEDRKREIIAQLDFQRDMKRVQSDQVELWALELGVSTLLVLEHCGEGRWRRLGVSWGVRLDYFGMAECRALTLQ